MLMCIKLSVYNSRFTHLHTISFSKSILKHQLWAVHDKLTCRISWFAAEMMSFKAAGGIFKPSRNTIDKIGPCIFHTISTTSSYQPSQLSGACDRLSMAMSSNFHPKPPRLPGVSWTASSKSASEKCQTTQQSFYNCRSIDVSWHSHLRTKGFHWSKVLLPAWLAEGNYGENVKSSLGVIYAISVSYEQLNLTKYI